MSDLLSQITSPISTYATEHSVNVANMSKNIDPSNMEDVTKLRMEWQKVTMAMELQSAMMSRLEKAIDTMISKM